MNFTSEIFLILLVIPLVLIFGYSGCVTDDEVRSSNPYKQLEKDKQAVEKKLEDEKQKGDATEQLAAEEKEKRKYQNVVRGEANLAGYWRLSEGENGNNVAKDSAPVPSHDGTYMGVGVDKNALGALQAVSQPDDKAAEFNGAGAYVEIAFAPLINPPQSFSLELWVRPSSGATGKMAILSAYEITGPGTSRGFALELESQPTPIVRAKIGAVDAEKSLVAPLGDGLEHDGWCHIVLTYESIEKRLRLYVNADNGLHDKELGSTSTNPVHFQANLAAHLRIGAGHSQAGAVIEPFNGRIDEVAVYREALNGMAIKKHFLAATSLPS
jgi:Concanavalin A-like lectin/glucanases superfamily